MQGLYQYKYKNSWDCLKQIVRAEGIKGLYKGFVPRVSRVLTSVPLVFIFFERSAEIILNLVPRH